jgi:hypothetical protein
MVACALKKLLVRLSRDTTSVVGLAASDLALLVHVVVSNCSLTE